MNRVPEIDQSLYDRVLPEYVRESLVRRPIVAPKVPQVGQKYPQVVTQPKPQPQRDKNNIALWPVLTGVTLIGLLVLAGSWRPQALPTPIPPLPTPSPAPTAVVEMVPPRAELVNPPAPRAKLMALPGWRVGQQQMVRMPDGLQVLATLRGSVFSASQLPLSGNHIGDTYVLGDNSEWVWLTAPGSTQATWIDP